MCQRTPLHKPPPVLFSRAAPAVHVYCLFWDLSSVVVRMTHTHIQVTSMPTHTHVIPTCIHTHTHTHRACTHTHNTHVYTHTANVLRILTPDKNQSVTTLSHPHTLTPSQALPHLPSLSPASTLDDPLTSDL